MACYGTAIDCDEIICDRSLTGCRFTRQHDEAGDFTIAGIIGASMALALAMIWFAFVPARDFAW